MSSLFSYYFKRSEITPFCNPNRYFLRIFMIFEIDEWFLFCKRKRSKDPVAWADVADITWVKKHSNYSKSSN